MMNSASEFDSKPATQYALLAPDDDDAFQKLLAIYQAAIAASEQKTPAELEQMLRDPRYRVLIALEGERVIGFAILFFPSRGGFWLLEYMAVETGLRSRGYGEGIFAAAKRIAGDVAAGMPCVLEVDQPGGNAPADDASRRLRFYRRLGCRRLEGIDYILPLKAMGNPPCMWLLVDGLGDRHAIGVDEAKRWLSAIYTEVYGQHADDPRISAMLSQASGSGLMRLQKMP